MKPKILKLSTVVLLLLFIGASCQKDQWEEVELEDTLCENVVSILNTIDDYQGIIGKTSELTKYHIIVDKPEMDEDLLYIPCNLPEKYKVAGLEIIFSGEILNVKDWIDGTSQGDLPATPIKLTKAKIK